MNGISTPTSQEIATGSPLGIVRRSQLKQAVGIGPTTVYELMQRGEFPRPVRLVGKCVGWRADELADWLRSRPRAAGVPQAQG